MSEHFHDLIADPVGVFWVCADCGTEFRSKAQSRVTPCEATP